MVYTAFSALCQLAIASIDVDDFKRLISRSAFGDYESEPGIREEWNRTLGRGKNGNMFSPDTNRKRAVFCISWCR